MAKRKSRDLGELPPAILTVASATTSEANIDTKGYDPAWDDPDFCKPKPETVRVEWNVADSNGTVSGTSEIVVPESIGHPISFGKTLDALLSGGKSVTRRTWTDRHAEHFIKRYESGLPVRAFDRDQRYGGQQIGWLKLTQKPYREHLADMPEADVIAEGFPELSKPEFLDRFFEGDADLTVWVIRFEFTPLEVEPEPNPVLENLSPSANVETSEPESVAVEVVQEVDSPAIDDELSYDEERDRLHLERKVERAFYEAGRALRELRDRRLYRSTHKTFEGYCRDRFGHSRQKSNFLIAAAGVYENLTTNGCQTEDEELTTNRCQNEGEAKMTTIRCQNLDMTTQDAIVEMTTNGTRILPTSEFQIRPLTKLEPELQPLAWDAAIEEAGGKLPSGRIVKDVVDRFVSPEPPPRAHHLSLVEGGLVEIRCPGNETIHSRYGRIAKVTEKTVEVWVRDLETMMMVKHTLKHHQVEVVPLENEPGCKELCDRIDRLRGRSLDPFDREILQLLDRAVVLTPREVEVLEAIEGRVGD